MAAQVGDKAPDFRLPATGPEETISLGQFRGKKNVVLYFFPFAFSSVCTQEMCALRDTYNQQFSGLDAQVLGISVDSPFTLRAWAEQQRFDFPLLSDFNKEVAKAYDVYYDELMGLRGVAKRAAFVIDKDGVIRYRWVTDDPKVLPDQEAIRRTLAELQG
ncbi:MULTISPECIES: peroxiredoxin [Thermaerobacter]|uniref:Peroxiredoxin n=1 Tax=Thermaerobacter composti TaxID=554949 RepID=A0ABZ0QRZ6_9FIRM|nr:MULTISPECIES: peroxiredoxin [Thermaerobacter]PZN08577.1 MAG: peroxiredoxin [Bacillota bacterium]QBS37142.1 peroxiredoxin [Thermaerobacter sp. FW80]WPD19145.1 peroxiredoxin [Thermaerobacter composti]